MKHDMMIADDCSWADISTDITEKYARKLLHAELFKTTGFKGWILYLREESVNTYYFDVENPYYQLAKMYWQNR